MISDSLANYYNDHYDTLPIKANNINTSKQQKNHLNYINDNDNTYIDMFN